ncbi:MAG: hypothetical protein U0821_04520 [Chloroflexota bacterium]
MAAQGTGEDNLYSLLSWRAVLSGFAVATILAALFGAAASRAGLEGNLGASAALELAAMVAGGFVAGWLGGRVGVVQALAVAVMFIIISASVKAWAEYAFVGDDFRRYSLLGPMDMGGLILGDMVHLLGACAGGWLADTIRARTSTQPD